MNNKLDNALRFHQDALSLLSRRQEVLASNIANADTPDYLARDIDFSAKLQQATARNQAVNGPVNLTRTSAAHIPAVAHHDVELLYRVPDQPAADGNTVNMDRERINFADNNIKYQSELTFLGGEIKKMMNVINQG